MKKILIREFLWLIATIFIAVVSGFAFLYFIDAIPVEESLISETEQTFFVQLFIVGFAFSFVGIYIIRIIVGIVRKLMLK